MKVVVLNYFLAMSISPQIQEKLHNEVDAVVGQKRLPTLQDRDSLPYLQAVFKECFRWLPALPTGASSYFVVSSILMISTVQVFSTGQAPVIFTKAMRYQRGPSS